jgi:hypothetical protein
MMRLGFRSTFSRGVDLTLRHAMGFPVDPSRALGADLSGSASFYSDCARNLGRSARARAAVRDSSPFPPPNLFRLPVANSFDGLVQFFPQGMVSPPTLTAVERFICEESVEVEANEFERPIPCSSFIEVRRVNWRLWDGHNWLTRLEGLQP